MGRLRRPVRRAGRVRVREHRLEPGLERVPHATKRLSDGGRDSDPAADDRQSSKYHQGYGDAGRRLVQVLALLARSAEGSMEGQEEEPEHVERREPRGREPDRPQDRVPGVPGPP